MDENDFRAPPSGCMPYVRALLAHLDSESGAEFVLRRSEPLPFLSDEVSGAGLDYADVGNCLKVLASVLPMQHQRSIYARITTELEGRKLVANIEFHDQTDDPYLRMQVVPAHKVQVRE